MVPTKNDNSDIERPTNRNSECVSHEISVSFEIDSLHTHTLTHKHNITNLQTVQNNIILRSWQLFTDD